MPQNISPLQVLVNSNPEIGLNKKVSQEPILIAKNTDKTMDINQVLYQSEITNKTPYIELITKKVSKIVKKTGTEYRLLKEELPLSALFKDSTKLKQDVKVFRNPKNNNKRIVLNTSSRFVKFSGIKKKKENNNNNWMLENNYKSVPTKKKPLFSQTRAPIAKKVSTGRQNSVSANIRYSDIRTNQINSNNYDKKIISNQYNTNSTKPTVNDNFINLENNEINSFQKKEELVESKIISSNYIEKKDEINWVNDLPTKTVNPSIYKSLNSVTSDSTMLKQYTSLQSKPLTERKIITTRKISQNEPTITNSTSKVVRYFNGNTRMSLNKNKNSNLWPINRPQIRNSFNPILEKPEINSFQPKIISKSRLSFKQNNRQFSTLNYPRESIYKNIKNSQPKTSILKTLPTRSIVLQKTRNSNLPIRYSENKNISPQITPVKGKSFNFLTKS